MLRKVVFNTDDYEICIMNKENRRWLIEIYKINYSSKELMKTKEAEDYPSAYFYVENHYLNLNKEQVV